MKIITLSCEVQDHTAELIQELAKEDETLFLIWDEVSHSIGCIQVEAIETVEEIENPMLVGGVVV